MSANNRPFLEFAYWRWPYCQWCGRRLARHEATADHVCPLVSGGDHSWENRVVSCAPCNNAKGEQIYEREPHGPRWTTPRDRNEHGDTLPARQIMSLGIIKAICGH